MNIYFPWKSILLSKLKRYLRSLGLMPRGSFVGSKHYWEARYAEGGTSGAGSIGKLAEFKAQVINSFVKEHEIQSVVDFGCGDGSQLLLAEYPRYIGLDVAPSAIEICRGLFKDDLTKTFYLYDPVQFDRKESVFRAELGLSIDVIYHLVEDEVFHLYMQHLFGTSTRFVIIYSSNFNARSAEHVLHRRFTAWIARAATDWRLKTEIDNRYPEDSSAKFYIYDKTRSENDQDI